MRVIMFDIDTLRGRPHGGAMVYGKGYHPGDGQCGGTGGYALTGIIVPTPRACPHVHP